MLSAESKDLVAALSPSGCFCAWLMVFCQDIDPVLRAPEMRSTPFTTFSVDSVIVLLTVVATFSLTSSTHSVIHSLITRSNRGIVRATMCAAVIAAAPGIIKSA